jgi:tagatose 1,6-diphosphate aldolase
MVASARPVSDALRSQIGRRRRLDALSGEGGIFAVAAIDHRDALTAAHAKAGLPAPTRETTQRFKAAVIRALAPHATGVMLDPEAGGLALAAGAPGRGPVVMPLEAQGYSDVESGRVTSFLPDWSPARALEAGASACKLLLPYRAEHDASASRQDEVVARAVAACHAAGLPLILEPIAYPLAGEDAAELARSLAPLVLASVARLQPIGPDVLKVQFPRDPAGRAAESEWCLRINDVCADTPWVLLGGGGDPEAFAADVEVACAAGASGFIAGRTLWAAALGLEGDALAARLEEECVPLVQRLRALAEAHAAPWRARLGPVAAPPDDWWSS